MVAVEIFNLSDHLPYEDIYPNGVVQLDGNGLTATIEYRGPNYETTPNTQLLSMLLRVQGYLAQFGRQEGWSLAANSCLVPAPSYLSAPKWMAGDQWSYDTELTDSGHIDRVRAARFNSGLIEERTFLSVSMRPSVKKAKWLDHALKSGIEEETLAWGPYLESFYDTVETLRVALHKEFAPAGFARILDATEWLRQHAFNIDGNEAGTSLRFPAGAKSYPVRGLVSRAVKYGRKIRLDGIPERHVRVVGVAGAPDNHHPELIQALTKCAAPLRLCQRFIVYPSQTLQAYYSKSSADAKDASKSLWQHFASVVPSLREHGEADAIGMAQYLKAEQDAASSAFIKSGGPLTTSVIIYEDTAKRADERAQEVVKVLKNDVEFGGFNALEEDIGVQAGYIGSFPGVINRYKRFDILQEYFLAARMRLTAPWTGNAKCRGPWGGAPILQGVVDGNRPYRFDPWHAGGWAHMADIGPTRCGKSSLMRVRAKGWRSRFPNGKIIDIDADAEHSASIVACLAAGGHYFPMDGSGAALQPLRAIDTPEQFSARVGLIKGICKAQGVTYTARIGEAIEDGLRLLASEPMDNRTMTTLQQLTSSPGSSVEAALSPYCKGGVWGGLMDGRRNPIPDSPWILLELGVLARKADDPTVGPVIEALLLSAEDAIEHSSQTLVLLDETKICKRAMGPRLIEWLARLAKLGAAAVLSLHYLDEDGDDGELIKAILAQCHTLLFHPSPTAMQPAARSWMAPLGVTEAMAEKIANAQKGNVCIIQGHDAAMVDFALGPEELAICATDGDAANEKAIEIYNCSPRGEFWKYLLASKQLYSEGTQRYADAAE